MSNATPTLVTLLLSLVVGCADLSPAPLPPGPAYSIPPPEGFDAGALHGLPWIDSPDGCVQCHRSAERIIMVDGCRDCHAAYPHPQGFDTPDEHGGLGSDGGFRCAACHGSGEARPADQQRSACRDCHQDYPHRITFREPNIHGPAARADITGCARCHGADWEGSLHADACFDCHALYPHRASRRGDDTGVEMERWALPRVHGTAARAEGNEACGGSCHGADFLGGQSEVACADCHAAYPHSVDIRVDHRALMHELGEESCLGCHDGNRGFPSSFGCTDTCHTQQP
jgi:hypothetical protein